MSSTLSKIVIPIIRPLLPYVPFLPTSLLTLPPSLLLHYTTHPSPSLFTFIRASTTHPIHLPIIINTVLTIILFPLGLISKNVSWVDRIWTFYPVILSALVLVWAWVNESGGVYGHNLPRLAVMLSLQILWSIRLTSHALRRGFLDVFSQDYRYTAFKKMVPWWAFQLMHLFVIVIAQPLLLLSLSLPLHSLLLLPPTELSSGPIPALSIPYSTFLPLLPTRFHISPPSTPILHIADLFLFLLTLTLLYIEMKSDNQMFEYQESKHALMAKSTSSDLVNPQTSNKTTNQNLPQPSPYPPSHHPGFPINGLYRYSRHANFACEQLFWVVQALFVIGAAESSGVTKQGWVIGSVFGPCFALSLLFCASTFLTEWISGRKYPAYGAYKQLVGQFLPQETVTKYVWTTLNGKRLQLLNVVYGNSPKPGKKE